MCCEVTHCVGPLRNCEWLETAWSLRPRMDLDVHGVGDIRSSCGTVWIVVEAQI